jgi:septal ring-binding cell division protein DamX
MDWRTFAEPDSPEINQLAPAQTVLSESAGANHSETSSEVSSTEAVNSSVTEEPSAENSKVASVGGDSQLESVSGETDRGAGELTADAATTAATQSEAEIVNVASTAAVDESAGSEPTATNAAKPDEQQPDQSAGETVPVISAEVDTEKTSAGSVAPLSSLASSGSDRFQRDIRASLEWIDGRAGSIGTLQIMLLSQIRFDENSYYDHIDRLARQGVDTSQIRILQTMTGTKKLLSVVYGEYKNRGAAGVAQADLPGVLQQASPIPRSVGALKAEMRRLEGQN